MHAYFHRYAPEEWAKAKKSGDTKSKILKTLHAKYKAASPAELQKLAGIAQSAKKHKGKFAFGKPACRAREGTVHKLKLSIWKRQKHETGVKRAESIDNAAVSDDVLQFSVSSIQSRITLKYVYLQIL